MNRLIAKIKAVMKRIVKPKHEKPHDEHEHHEHEELRLLHEIAHTLREILRRLTIIPNQLTIKLEGEEMAAKTYPLNTTATGHVVEVDNTKNPPAPFAYAKGSVVYTQSGGGGTFVDNTDGSFSYEPPMGRAEVVTVTATDSVSNPNLVLTNTAVLTFAEQPVVPNQLDIVLD